MRIREIITELRSIGDDKNLEDKQFILLDNGYVIFFDDIAELEDLEPESMKDTWDRVIDFYHGDGPIAPKWIKGSINDNIVSIDSDEVSPNSVLNKNIQKMIQKYDLDGIKSYITDFETGDEEEHFIHQTQILKQEIGSVTMYHGTNSGVLKQILSKGLMPTHDTNFRFIEHTDKVFFTTKKETAYFHAKRQAMDKNKVPVIIAFKVPDPAKIVLDFDIALVHYGKNHPLVKKLGYDKIADDVGMYTTNRLSDEEAEDMKLLSDKNSPNTKVGIFGYTGRIPPSYFTDIITDAEQIVLEELTGEIESTPNMTQYSSVKEFKDSLDHYRQIYEYDEYEDEDE